MSSGSWLGLGALPLARWPLRAGRCGSKDRSTPCALCQRELRV